MASPAKVLYLKGSCPFCLKLVIGLTEVGAFKGLAKKDDSEDNRAGLQAKLGEGEKLTFPCLETGDTILCDSDAILKIYADEASVKVEDLEALTYYKNGIFPAYMSMAKHIGHDKVGDIINGKTAPK